MKKFAGLLAVVCLAVLAVLSFYGCNPSGSTGIIQLNVKNQVAAKTLLPDISMTVETFFIQLTGPNGELIEEEVDFRYEVGEEKNQIDVFSSWHGASLKPPSEKITTALTNIPDEALAEDNKG